MLLYINIYVDSVGVVVFYMLGKMSITASIGTIYLFTAEQLPTPIRNIGLGSCSTMGRIGSILAPLVNEFVSCHPRQDKSQNKLVKAIYINNLTLIIIIIQFNILVSNITKTSTINFRRSCFYWSFYFYIFARDTESKVARVH